MKKQSKYFCPQRKTFELKVLSVPYSFITIRNEDKAVYLIPVQMLVPASRVPVEVPLLASGGAAMDKDLGRWSEWWGRWLTTPDCWEEGGWCACSTSGGREGNSSGSN